MKRLYTLLLSTALLLCLTVTAWADYDYIDRYDVTVTPNTQDGSLLISVDLTWTALEELPYGQYLKIGVPNGSIQEETALTDNIERLDFDNEYMYVYLDQDCEAGETFRFAYSWVQTYMYTLDDAGQVYYSYTPGWFDEAKIGEMTLTWNDPAGVTGELGGYCSSVDADMDNTGSSLVLSARDLTYGSTMTLEAIYRSWPTTLYQENSADSLPSDLDGSGYYYDDQGENTTGILVGAVIFVAAIVIAMLIVRYGDDGYAGGFGTRYVFVNNLWYPAGPDGRPRPGSTGTRRRPQPPHHSGGFGGGSRGGGFGGGGFGGGGGHCACASSCACACACACAGGGRAGCSAKNLYGAVKLGNNVSRKLTEQ